MKTEPEKEEWENFNMNFNLYRQKNKEFKKFKIKSVNTKT
jgi:hypothetical protein